MFTRTFLAASHVLNDLLASGEIRAEQADSAKAKYTQLHGALVKALQTEKDLLLQAKALKRQKEDQDTALAGVGGLPGLGVGADDIDQLREDVEAALSEAALAQERQQLLQLEVTDLQRQRNELGARMEELAAEHAAALQPLINQARGEAAALTDELDEERRRVEAARQELDDARTRLASVQADIASLSEAKAVERANLVKIDPLPDKARRQADAVGSILKSVQVGGHGTIASEALGIQNGITLPHRKNSKMYHNLRNACGQVCQPGNFWSLFRMALRVAAGQLDSMNARLAEHEAQYRTAAARERELQEDHSKMLVSLDRGRVQVEAKARHADDIRKDVELASIEADKILTDQVELDLRIKNLVVELKAESDHLNRRQREKELMLRQYRLTEQQLKDARDMLPNLKFQVEQLHRDVNTLEARRKSQSRELQEIKRELDIQMAAFLHEEADGKGKVALFQLTFKEVALLESELAALKREEAEREMILRDLGSQRDRIALSIAQRLRKVKDVQMTSRIKEVELAELKKIRKEVGRRIRDFEKLYDLVKNQRNKFVNLIQAASQSTTEMKDKLKVLQNELDILQNEVGIKDKLLQQQHTQHQANIAERDQLRVELGRLGMVFRDKQTVVDEQISEVDKLNAIINGCEKEMLRLKKQYELVIEARNYTGIMLIDRNDELCVLYEKANIQEEVIRGGQLELRRRDDEARLLRLEVAELERSIAVMRRLVPSVPLLDTDVAALQKELFEARREAEALSLALENPSNQSRWRMLEGKIPDREELSAKIQRVGYTRLVAAFQQRWEYRTAGYSSSLPADVLLTCLSISDSLHWALSGLALEERLNDKKEQLLEKELILEEITSLSDKLRVQAAEGRADTLELAKRVNEYQSKLRAVTRKIMATVSELSMYQASALKLGAEKEELESAVSLAAQRLEAGEPPTDDTEREWARIERERQTLEILADERKAIADALDGHTSQVQSTADPRPNAYIPENLGIPKPYGSFAPFKPQEPGSTMRHIRKPVPKEIVI
ncbi:coiled-coil protein required for normal flagellar motility [Volvox carteri f. nagariensis]|uniref:Coiled-coil protein required for normal flagellar motility n=1 Tax=Volvox carteri f. nagariensis TaxID=3068 RepID=D8UBV7_VOLCA|nr:coiled-coil protein required for normal flagellar motility [Volvox carteri f. nagariensis]EFJ42885.1 coiled-coil protein required for normal flagellar motility [Volvox carteri f. nagariensis]|eukprot:XP_002956145.1 coiled-coil protein required for normal flagellar motility [Volvox carteri f. nagariensis]